MKSPTKPALAKAIKRLQRQPEKLKQLRTSLQNGREIDWDFLKPLIEVPHNDDDDPYPVPKHQHGTHVGWNNRSRLATNQTLCRLPKIMI